MNYNPTILHEEIAVLLGEQVNDNWYMHNDRVILSRPLEAQRDAVDAIIAEHKTDAKVLHRAMQAKKIEVKSKARSLIEEKYPDRVHIQYIEDGNSMSPTQFTAYKNKKKSLRTQHKAFKAEIEALTTVEEIEAYEYNYIL